MKVDSSYVDDSGALHQELPAVDLPYSLDRGGQNPMQSNIDTDSDLKTSMCMARPSCFNRLGLFALIILIIAPVITIVSISFLSFLWFAQPTNSTWNNIVLHGYLTQIVAILSEVIKAAILFELGIFCSILAAVVLERWPVTLGEAADLSIARVGSSFGDLCTLLRSRLRKTSRSCDVYSWAILILLMLVTVFFAFSQILTFVLVGDIGLAHIPGAVQTVEAAVGMDAHLLKTALDVQYARTPLWSSKPAFYPTFAEESLPPTKLPGVADTGPSLRAFLPFKSAQNREILRTYNGNAVLLDARVTCQAPHIEPEVITVGDDMVRLKGNIRSSRQTPQMSTMSEVINVMCFASAREQYGGPKQGQWKLSVCNHEVGGLTSQFESSSDTKSSSDGVGREQDMYARGRMYILVNVTKLDPDDDFHLHQPRQIEVDEWLQFISASGNSKFGVTLCNAAFSAIYAPVQISSTKERSEPSAKFNTSDHYYVLDGVRSMYGQNESLSFKERGILRLKSDRKMWEVGGKNTFNLNYLSFPGDFENPTILYSSTVTGSSEYSKTSKVELISSILGKRHSARRKDLPAMMTGKSSFYHPELSIRDFVQDILLSGGNMAFALQSLLMLGASMLYYDMLPLFDRKETISFTEFVTANVPVRYTGFVSVLIFLILQFSLLAFSVAMFFKLCQYSLLGDSWQAVTQLMVPVIDDEIQRTSSFGLRDAEGRAKGIERWQDKSVRLVYLDKLGRPGFARS